MQVVASAQTANTHTDTLFYQSLIKQNTISTDSTVSVNKNGYSLNLNKTDALKIARVMLKASEISFRRPLELHQYMHFWIVLSRAPKGYGGKVILILNSKNGAVELFYAEK